MLVSWRVTFFVFLVLVLIGLIFYRLVFLAVWRHDHFEQLAQAQYQFRQERTAQRGKILFSDYRRGQNYLLAASRAFPFIYAVPKQSHDPEVSAQKLSNVFGIPLEKSEEIFRKTGDPFELVITRPNERELEQARLWEGSELAIGYEDRRYYPENQLVSQVLGFLGFAGDQQQGQYGLEEFYEKTLTGYREETVSENSSAMKKRGFWSLWPAAPSQTTGVLRDGSDLILSLDRSVQQFAQEELNYLMRRWRPETGLVIVQDPRNGQILAMVGSPSYDPNSYSQSPLDHFVNRSIQEMFEPGSSFKPITLASALDQKKITPETTYFDSGEVNIAGYRIKNFNEKSFGYQTMNQVLEKSLNTGAIFAEEQLGDEAFLDYLLNFGFGQPTGVDLAGEIAGDISNLYTKRKINFVTASFGQGIAVTPIQLVNGFSALANGGKMYRPQVVKEIVKPNGERLEIPPELISTPINERTSAQIKAMLVKVVENGFDKATVPGYEVAGKTGTAQIASPEGGYSDDFIHDIVGFGPAFSPRFVVLIKIDKPQGIRFAADSLSSSLGKIMSFLFNYFEIPPTK